MSWQNGLIMLLSLSFALALMQDGPPIVLREQWGAKPAALAQTRHSPSRITIHHAGVPQKPEVPLETKLKNLQSWCQREDKLASGKVKPAWADIPYHYYISTDGRIGECRYVIYVGDTNTEYDPTGHILIVVEGDTDKEEVTAEQKQSLKSLVLWLAKKWRIAPDHLGAHKDFAKTDCPGKRLYEMMPELRSLIKL